MANENDGRIDYVEIAVNNVAAAKKFYSAAFGWTFEDYGPDYASFHDGRLRGGVRTIEGGDTRGNNVLIVLYAVDLEAMQQKVMASGGTIVKPIFSFPGGRRFHFVDPSDNELAIWSDH